jgi:hypothetical protein
LKRPSRPTWQLIALAIGASGGSHASAEGKAMMSEATRDRIVAAAAKDQRWNAAQVKLVPKEELDRAGCSFYAAVPEDRAAHAPGYFGLLPDGRVVGIDLRGDDAAAALLAACGREAPADWWATVVARFSDRIGGSVLTESGNPFGIRKVRERGATFAPPALRRSAEGTELSFFVYDAELQVPHQVQALLSADGKLRVESKAL